MVLAIKLQTAAAPWPPKTCPRCDGFVQEDPDGDLECVVCGNVIVLHGVTAERLPDVKPSATKDQPSEISLDKGCEIARRCVECPLPRCHYELTPGQRNTMRKMERYRVIRALWDSGMRHWQIHQQLGISDRTVDRARRATAGGKS